MSDHTPAPWKIKENGKGLTPSIVTADEFAATWEIARIKDVPAGAYKANARLIAAAPDLLQALEDLLFATAKVEDRPESILGIARKNAAAAITKAK